MQKHVVFLENKDVNSALRLISDDGFRLQRLGGGVAAFHTHSASQAQQLNLKLLSSGVHSVTSFEWNLFGVTGSIAELEKLPKITCLIWPKPGNENLQILAVWRLDLQEISRITQKCDVILKNCHLQDILTICVIPLSSIGKCLFLPFRDALLNEEPASDREKVSMPAPQVVKHQPVTPTPAAKGPMRFTPQQMLDVRMQMEKTGQLHVRPFPVDVLSTEPRIPIRVPSSTQQRHVDVQSNSRQPLHVPLPTRSQGLPAILETLLAAYRPTRTTGPPPPTRPQVRVPAHPLRSRPSPTENGTPTSAWEEEQRLFELLSVAQKVVAGQVGCIKSPTRASVSHATAGSPNSRAAYSNNASDTEKAGTMLLNSLKSNSPSKEVVESVAMQAFQQSCLRVSKHNQSLNPAAPEFQPRFTVSARSPLLQLLFDAGQDGVDVDVLPQLYMRRYGTRLVPMEFGASDVKSLLAAMWPDVVVLSEVRKPQSLKPELEVIRRALQLPLEQEVSVARATVAWSPPANRLIQQLLVALVSDLVVADVGHKPSTLLTGVSLTRLPYEWRRKYGSQHDLHTLLLESGSPNLLHFCSCYSNIFELLRSGSDMLIRVKTSDASDSNISHPQAPPPCSQSPCSQSITKTMLHRMVVEVVAAGCARQASAWERDMDLSEMQMKRSLDVEDKGKRKKEEGKRRQLASSMTADMRSCLEIELLDEYRKVPGHSERQSYRNDSIGVLVSSIKSEWARKWRPFYPLDSYLGQFGIKKMKILLLEIPELIVIGSEGNTRVCTVSHAEHFCKPVPTRYPTEEAGAKLDFSVEKIQQLLCKLLDHVCEEQSAMFRLAQDEGRLSTLTSIAARCFGGESLRSFPDVGDPREFDDCVIANGVFGIKLVDLPMAWWLLYRSSLHEVILSSNDGQSSIEDILRQCPSLTIVGTGDAKRCVTHRHPPKTDQRDFLDSALQSMQQTAAAHEAAISALTSALAQATKTSTNWEQESKQSENVEPSTTGTSAVCHEI